MANQIPFAGTSDAAGGILLPVEQGEILTNGILQESGALSLAGDSRSTSSRKETFAIWQGAPTAEFVGEGGTKPVTGGEFGAGTLNVKKVASIVMFTDEMIDDVQNGDLNVLVDGGVRSAIADVIDEHAVGIGVSSQFDTELVATSQTIGLGTNPDALRLAVSAAMGTLEANGYGGQQNMGVLLAPDFARHIRDARNVSGTVDQLYDTTTDPLYGIQRAYSTHLGTATSGTVSSDVLAIVVHRPNLHVRIRQDVTVKASNEASLVVDGNTRSLYQEDLNAVRYVTRLGFFVHDLNRAVVKITRS